MMKLASLLVVLFSSALAADLTASENAAKIDPRFFCPKPFVPGRPGGFVSAGGRQGCCLAGSAAGLMEIIYAMHHCKAFHGNTDTQECQKGALDKLLAATKKCCRDGDDDSAKCKAAVADSNSALHTDLADKNDACIAAKNSGDHAAAKSKCKAAVDGAINAFKELLKDARTLYNAGDASDYTRLSRGFVNLCEHLDEPRCLSKVRYVIKHYHMNFAW